MTKEEFIEKVGVANKTVNGLEKMIQKIKQDKSDVVQIFIEVNKKFKFGERVRCFENESFIGYGYVNSIFSDEDYGIIFYEIFMEDVLTKQKTNQYFSVSQFGTYLSDKKYCKLTLDKVE